MDVLCWLRFANDMKLDSIPPNKPEVLHEQIGYKYGTSLRDRGQEGSVNAADFEGVLYEAMVDLT